MAMVSQDVVGAYLVVLSVQVVFASYQIMTKMAFQENTVDPVVFAFLRLAGAAVVFWLMVFLPGSPAQEKDKKYIWPRPEHRKRFACMGLCMFGNVVGLVMALKFTTSSMVAMLQVLRPVFAGVISWSLGIERPTMRQILGLIFCVMGGLAIVVCNDRQASTLAQSSMQPRNYLGAALVCVHSFSIALYVVEQPYLVDVGYSASTINAQSYTFATVLCGFVLALPGVGGHGSSWLPPDAFSWLTIAHAVFLVAIYSYVAMAWAAKKLGGVVVMLFMLLQAVIILTVGHIVLHEVMYVGQLVGASLVVVGIFTFILDPSGGSKQEGLPILDADGKDATTQKWNVWAWMQRWLGRLV